MLPTPESLRFLRVLGVQLEWRAQQRSGAEAEVGVVPLLKGCLVFLGPPKYVE